MPVCRKCSLAFPNKIKIDGKVHSLNRRQYCLDCSPYKQHNTKVLEKQIEGQLITNMSADGTRYCPRCKQILPAALYYLKHSGTRLTGYCKSCTNRQAVERQQSAKKQCVDYKGGRCERCGYNGYIGALEFHHINADGKDFDLSHGKSTTFEKIKPELDKCILVCANCHRKLHAIERGLVQPYNAEGKS